MKLGVYRRSLKGKMSIKGKRLTNRDSRNMNESEIIQTEEKISMILEMANKPFISVDISNSPDQSMVAYISNSRKLLNCKDCLYYEKCDKRDADGLIIASENQDVLVQNAN